MSIGRVLFSLIFILEMALPGASHTFAETPRQALEPQFQALQANALSEAGVSFSIGKMLGVARPFMSRLMQWALPKLSTPIEAQAEKRDLIKKLRDKTGLADYQRWLKLQEHFLGSSIVRIKDASGFIVAEDKDYLYAMTNSHVVKMAEAIPLQFGPGPNQSILGRVIVRHRNSSQVANKQEDIALIAFQKKEIESQGIQLRPIRFANDAETTRLRYPYVGLVSARHHAVRATGVIVEMDSIYRDVTPNSESPTAEGGDSGSPFIIADPLGQPIVIGMMTSMPSRDEIEDFIYLPERRGVSLTPRNRRRLINTFSKCLSSNASSIAFVTNDPMLLTRALRALEARDISLYPRTPRGLTPGGAKGFFGNRRGSLSVGNGDDVDMSELEFLHALSSKAGTRFVLEGGPMHKPHPYFILRRDPQAKATLSNPDYESDLSYDPRLIPESEVHDFQTVTQQFMAGQLSSRLIFKPNQSADGRGVMQWVRVNDSMVIVRMCWSLDHPDFFPPTTAAIHRVEEKNYGRIQYLYSSNLIEIHIRDNAQHIQDVLVDLWRTVSVSHDANTYDSGILEVWQDYLDTQDGKAFEMRLAYFGNLGDGSISEFLRGIPVGIPYSGSLGKMGSSGIVSSVTHRGPQAQRLAYDEALETLASLCHISSSRIPALDAYLQEQVARESRYRADRLRKSGFELSIPIYGEFDVRFFAPLPGEEFPRVSLIESLVRRMGDRPFGVRVYGRTLSAA